MPKTVNTQAGRYGTGKLKRYIVDTKIEVDAPQSASVEYVAGWKAACQLALSNAYSQQTTTFVKDLRTGNKLGGYRYASHTQSVACQGLCK
jgi:hypothetical protein